LYGYSIVTSLLFFFMSTTLTNFTSTLYSYHFYQFGQHTKFGNNISASPELTGETLTQSRVLLTHPRHYCFHPRGFILVTPSGIHAPNHTKLRTLFYSLIHIFLAGPLQPHNSTTEILNNAHMPLFRPMRFFSRPHGLPTEQLPFPTSRLASQNSPPPLQPHVPSRLSIASAAWNTCLCLSQLLTGGYKGKAASRAVALQGAAAPCYSMV
jgi:hypothetical protein